MKIGDRIKSRREQLDMSQDDLAQKTGYKSRSSINKIEKGLTDINQTKISEFASALDTTIAYLMGWENLTTSQEFIQEKSRVNRVIKDNQNQPETIAAHHDGEDWTEEELEDIELFKEMLRKKRERDKK